jgi:hypothetical protein
MKPEMARKILENMAKGESVIIITNSVPLNIPMVIVNRCHVIYLDGEEK